MLFDSKSYLPHVKTHILRNTETFHEHLFCIEYLESDKSGRETVAHIYKSQSRRASLRVFLGTIYRRVGRKSEFYISINRPFVLNTFGCNRVSGLRSELKIERRSRGTITSEKRVNGSTVIYNIRMHPCYICPRREITFIRQICRQLCHHGEKRKTFNINDICGVSM